MANLSQSSMVWRGLTIGGPSQGGSYQLRDIAGWEELPAYTTQKTPVAGGHGTRVSAIQFGERVVTVTGWVFDQGSRDTLFAALQSSLAPGPDTLVTEPLTINHAARSLSADARLVRFNLEAEAGWANGRFNWIAQWLCSDPLRYGGMLTFSSPFPQPGAGLALPASLPNAFPASVPGGGVQVSNDGSASTPATYTITGPVSWPGVLLSFGAQQRMVQYQMTLAQGDQLVIATADGGAGRVNGEYRVPYGNSDLTSDLVLRPGVNQVQGLGTASSGSPAPSIAVTFRPAYW